MCIGYILEIAPLLAAVQVIAIDGAFSVNGFGYT